MPTQRVPRTGNIVTGLALCAAVGVIGSGPLLYKRWFDKHHGNLTNQEAPLSGSQIIRGAYLNSGSTDIGRDPDWDPKTHTWRGRRKVAGTQKSNQPIEQEEQQSSQSS